MNIERLRAVRDAILNPPEGFRFNMAESGRYCGCIAALADSDFFTGSQRFISFDRAGDELGLTESQQEQLFRHRQGGGTIYETLTNITPAQAAATIDHLIDSFEKTGVGEVVWGEP